VAAVCAGALVFAATLDGMSSLGLEWWAKRQILTASLTGGLLLGIAVLVVEALLAEEANRTWHPSARVATRAVLRAGRHRGDELVKLLLPQGEPVQELSDETARKLTELTRELHNALDARVGNAVRLLVVSQKRDLAHCGLNLVEAADKLARVVVKVYERGQGSITDVYDHFTWYVEAICRFDQVRLDRCGWGPELDPEEREWLLRGGCRRVKAPQT
jgi:hypothetical protein